MATPQIAINPAAAKRLRHFDAWVFRDELVRAEDLPNGEPVELIDRDGSFIAHAFYSNRSHIAARVFARRRDEGLSDALLKTRLSAALARRQRIQGTTARRLFFSEADGLPGLIVDQYGDVVVLQSRTAGVERCKERLMPLLQDALKPAGILERSDKEFRQEEGLEPLRQVHAGRVPDRITIEEHGLRFQVDVHNGHKTGFYIDQRDTRAKVRSLITPGQRVVDVFSYTGGFAIGAASQGAEVLCVERDTGAIELGRENAKLNGVDQRISLVEGDAFAWLESKGAGRERFDWVLLDPPGLAKNRQEITAARRALHHLLVHGLKLLKPSGGLALSICTYHLLPVAEEILRIAAEDVGVGLRALAVSQQAEDHPWLLQVPATRYLASWVVRREE